MITLYTGTPGSGKTLRAVSDLVALRKTEEGSRRPIFTNINGLDRKLACTPLDDPKKWHELPAGSLIVIDEAQTDFPSRGAASAVPPHVQPFATHRHRGLDVWVITQKPALIDHFLRSMVGRHLHVYRPFGLERVQILEWQECCDSPRVDAKPIPQPWSYPHEIFSLYRSAQIHTHKRRLPWRSIGIVAGCGLVAAVGVIFAFYRLSSFTGAHKPAPEVAQVQTPTTKNPSIYTAPASGAVWTAPDTGQPAAAPAQPVTTVPVLEYHGWTSFRGHVEFLLCLPAPAPAGGGVGESAPAPSGPGCQTEITWAQVMYHRAEGSSVVVMAGPHGPDLYKITDPSFQMDLVAHGSGSPVETTAMR